MPPDAPVDVELLIEARWVLPMSEDLPVLVDHGVAIRAGRLLGPWPIASARQRVNAQRVLRLDLHALMPGLVNAHNHAGMSLMRGFADDLPLLTWLNEHIWPAEAAHINPGFVADGARALGLGQRVGQLREGYEADLIAVDLDALNTQPVHHPASALVYAMNSRQVSHAWVAGRPRLVDGELCDIDTQQLKHMAAARQRAMAHTRQQGEAQ